MHAPLRKTTTSLGATVSRTVLASARSKEHLGATRWKAIEDVAERWLSQVTAVNESGVRVAKYLPTAAPPPAEQAQTVRSASRASKATQTTTMTDRALAATDSAAYAEALEVIGRTMASDADQAIGSVRAIVAVNKDAEQAMIRDIEAWRTSNDARAFARLRHRVAHGPAQMEAQMRACVQHALANIAGARNLELRRLEELDGEIGKNPEAAFAAKRAARQAAIERLDTLARNVARRAEEADDSRQLIAPLVVAVGAELANGKLFDARSYMDAARPLIEWYDKLGTILNTDAKGVEDMAAIEAVHNLQRESMALDDRDAVAGARLENLTKQMVPQLRAELEGIDGRIGETQQAIDLTTDGTVIATLQTTLQREETQRAVIRAQVDGAQQEMSDIQQILAGNRLRRREIENAVADEHRLDEARQRAMDALRAEMQTAANRANDALAAAETTLAQEQRQNNVLKQTIDTERARADALEQRLAAAQDDQARLRTETSRESVLQTKLAESEEARRALVADRESLAETLSETLRQFQEKQRQSTALDTTAECALSSFGKLVVALDPSRQALVAEMVQRTVEATRLAMASEIQRQVQVDGTRLRAQLQSAVEEAEQYRSAVEDMQRNDSAHQGSLAQALTNVQRLTQEQRRLQETIGRKDDEIGALSAMSSTSMQDAVRRAETYRQDMDRAVATAKATEVEAQLQADSSLALQRAWAAERIALTATKERADQETLRLVREATDLRAQLRTEQTNRLAQEGEKAILVRNAADAMARLAQTTLDNRQMADRITMLTDGRTVDTAQGQELSAQVAMLTAQNAALLAEKNATGTALQEALAGLRAAQQTKAALSQQVELLAAQKERADTLQRQSEEERRVLAVLQAQVKQEDQAFRQQLQRLGISAATLNDKTRDQLLAMVPSLVLQSADTARQETSARAKEEAQETIRQLQDKQARELRSVDARVRAEVTAAFDSRIGEQKTLHRTEAERMQQRVDELIRQNGAADTQVAKLRAEMEKQSMHLNEAREEFRRNLQQTRAQAEQDTQKAKLALAETEKRLNEATQTLEATRRELQQGRAMGEANGHSVQELTDRVAQIAAERDSAVHDAQTMRQAKRDAEAKMLVKHDKEMDKLRRESASQLNAAREAALRSGQQMEGAETELLEMQTRLRESEAKALASIESLKRLAQDELRDKTATLEQKLRKEHAAAIAQTERRIRAESAQAESERLRDAQTSAEKDAKAQAEENALKAITEAMGIMHYKKPAGIMGWFTNKKDEAQATTLAEAIDAIKQTYADKTRLEKEKTDLNASAQTAQQRIDGLAREVETAKQSSTQLTAQLRQAQLERTRSLADAEALRNSIQDLQADREEQRRRLADASRKADNQGLVLDVARRAMAQARIAVGSADVQQQLQRVDEDTMNLIQDALDNQRPTANLQAVVDGALAEHARRYQAAKVAMQSVTSDTLALQEQVNHLQSGMSQIIVAAERQGILFRFDAVTEDLQMDVHEARMVAQEVNLDMNMKRLARDLLEQRKAMPKGFNPKNLTLDGLHALMYSDRVAGAMEIVNRDLQEYWRARVPQNVDMSENFLPNLRSILMDAFLRANGDEQAFQSNVRSLIEAVNVSVLQTTKASSMSNFLVDYWNAPSATKAREKFYGAGAGQLIDDVARSDVAGLDNVIFETTMVDVSASALQDMQGGIFGTTAKADTVAALAMVHLLRQSTDVQHLAFVGSGKDAKSARKLITRIIAKNLGSLKEAAKASDKTHASLWSDELTLQTVTAIVNAAKQAEDTTAFVAALQRIAGAKRDTVVAGVKVTLDEKNAVQLKSVNLEKYEVQAEYVKYMPQRSRFHVAISDSGESG